MTLVSNHTTQQVVNPHLTDDQIEEVSRQLGAILHSDMGEWGVDDAGECGPTPPSDEGQDEAS